MKTILIFIFLLGAPPRTVVVQKGETLEQIAKRELGESAAASELAALNGISKGTELKKRTVLTLPGEERQRAVRALNAAAKKVEAAQEPHREPARAKLKDAWASLRAARYTEAQARAETAEKRAKGGVTKFTITADEGTKESRFTVESGTLAVSGGGKVSEARAGQSVRVGKKGHTVRSGPPAPLLTGPDDGGVVDRAGAQLSWQPSKGARGYVVVVARDLALLDRVATIPLDAVAVTLPPALPKGVYYWRVSAVAADGAEGPAAGPRVFQVTREPGKGAEWDWGPIWDPWGRGLPGQK